MGRGNGWKGVSVYVGPIYGGVAGFSDSLASRPRYLSTTFQISKSRYVDTHPTVTIIQFLSPLLSLVLIFSPAYTGLVFTTKVQCAHATIE